MIIQMFVESHDLLGLFTRLLMRQVASDATQPRGQTRRLAQLIASCPSNPEGLLSYVLTDSKVANTTVSNGTYQP